jgi:hypothetical protein
LHLFNDSRTLTQPKSLCAKPDGAGTYHQHFNVRGAQTRNLLDQAAQQAKRDFAVAAHQHVGSEFDDDAAHVELDVLAF